MLHLIDTEYSIIDRFILSIYKTSFFESDGVTSHFIMGKNIDFISKKHTCKGTAGIYTKEKFSINGKSVIIKFPGINFSRTIINSFDHTSHGDLSYIDGCSNSIIIPPPRNGDPCLNYLYFPENINQTLHTHPSVRIGFILSGKGYANISNNIINLNKGDAFILDRHTLHNFSTTDSSMSLMIFHPDSDAGPTDEFNLMKTRTYIK